MGIKIGIELEGNLIDRMGSISNTVSEVVSDKLNNRDIGPELSKAMFEITAPLKDNL